MEGERFVNAAEDRDKMGLEGLDCFLCNVLAVVLWRCNLVSHFILFYYALEIGGALIVQDVLFWPDSTLVKPVNHMLVCPDHFA
jgi:hypothetical protein